jgi:hypothetical protein
LLLACVSSMGCASTQLRRASVNHADTLSEIYQQQVLDNLVTIV